jgi:hypothetical protein
MEKAASAVSWRPCVGDCVRVAVPGGRRCEACPHFDGEAGRTGRIVRGSPQPYAPSHPYLVMFDEPCFVETVFSGRLPIAAHHYAADELESLA